MHEEELDHGQDLEPSVNMTRLDRVVVFVGDQMSWLFLAGVVIAVFEIISRYAFNAPTRWAHETTIFLVGSCLLAGGAYCLATDKHIRIGVVADQFPPKLKRVVDLVNTVLMSGFLGMLIYATWLMTQKAWFTPVGALRLERSGSSWNPSFPAILKAFLLIIVVVMFIQALLHIWRAIKEFRSDAR